jgi:hypothetical protein
VKEPLIMAPSFSKVAIEADNKMDPIVGMNINTYYSIGSFLGEGNVGKVYAVYDCFNMKTSKWAAKVAPHSSLTSSSNDSNESTSASSRLESEHHLYVQHLRHLCGKSLPSLPNKKKIQLRSFYSKIFNEGTLQ